MTIKPDPALEKMHRGCPRGHGEGVAADGEKQRQRRQKRQLCNEKGGIRRDVLAL